MIQMPELGREGGRNRCPCHGVAMKLEHDKYGTPFEYCPLSGYYRYYDGRKGHDSSLIRGPTPGPTPYGNPNFYTQAGPTCPRCQSSTIPAGNGWFCPNCKCRF